MALPEGFDSIRGTARALGCSHPTLIDGLNDGRIPESAVLRNERGQRIGLHVEQVRAAMAANTDPAQSARRGLQWTPTEAPKVEAPAAAPKADTEPGDASYHEARAERERAQAAMAQLELAKQLGQLALVSDVERAAQTAARATRDALLSIPDRVAALVAAETDTARVHAILSNELKQALHGLADRLPAGAG